MGFQAFYFLLQNTRQFLYFRLTEINCIFFCNLDHEKYSMTGINTSAYGIKVIAHLRYMFTLFVILTWENVTLPIAIGPFVEMTFESWPSLGKNRLICGKG